mgnify:FL=1
MFTKLQLGIAAILAAVLVVMGAVHAKTPALVGDAERTLLDTGTVRQPALEAARVLEETGLVYQSMGESVGASEVRIDDIRARIADLIALAEAEKNRTAQQKAELDRIIAQSEEQKKKTSDVLDQVLSNILGDPIGQTFGKRATIKVFTLKEAGYRGYMAKVKLHDPSAVRLVLSHDKVGDKGETTSQAAKRTGAKLAVNGGGFATAKGLIYPMGITVVDGEIKTFDIPGDDWSFIGFDKKGRLVGGNIKTKEELKKLGVQHGASFVPTLLKDGKKQKIPSKWANRREPRTMIGHFSNGDLLFIVIDGRQKDYSLGVTLEEAQEKLLEFNVRDAYNLDGGGSSTFYYNGKVLNRPSDGKERLLASSFVVLP